jgi:diguanylate cyclase (GGDEF)-like protein
MRKQQWEFFENMNELVYVADVDTYELVYMNRKTREMYGIDSVAQLQGRLCYEVLQGCAKPCSICNNRKLEPDKFDEWTCYNPTLQRYFSLKDTLLVDSGRRYRVELAIDTTDEEHQRQTIRSYIDNETMLNEALRLSLRSEMPEDSLKILLEYLGKALHSERVYIFEEDEDHYSKNTYEWCATGVSAEIDNLQHVSPEATALWYDWFHRDGSVIIRDLEETRETDPVMYDVLKPQNIRSLVASPLIDGERFIGFYGVDNPPVELLDNIATLFQIMGHFIVSLLRRRALVRRLESMSYFDQLTGCRNRHALELAMKELVPTESIGLLYCDVSGLKKLNDTQGHQAGDALLVRAGTCLRRIFSDEQVFRMGGDEFLVLCIGVNEAAMPAMAARLKRELAAQQVRMAVGGVWRPDSTCSVDHLLTCADAEMYRDKALDPHARKA